MGSQGRGKRLAMVGLEWFEDHPGGAARYMGDLARGLAARGHQVTVAVPRLLPNSPSEAWVDGVRVLRHAGPLGRWGGAWACLRQAQRKDGAPFDVLHSHFAPYGLWPLWAPDFRRARRVVQFQGPWAAESAIEGDPAPKVALKRGLERLAYARGEAFVVLSEAFGRLLAQDYGVPPDRIQVIPAAVDLGRFRPSLDRQALRARLGWAPGLPVIFTVRRLVRRMGLDALLQALALLPHPSARLLIAGAGPLAGELEGQAEGLGLAGRVVWLGRLSDEALVEHYQAADLVVMPTTALEGFGLPSAEALACGTPVVATAVGANPEVLAPWPEALVPPGDPAALAQALGAWLDPRGGRPSALDCRAQAEAHHAWPAILDRLEGVLLGP